MRRCNLSARGGLRLPLGWARTSAKVFLLFCASTWPSRPVVAADTSTAAADETEVPSGGSCFSNSEFGLLAAYFDRFCCFAISDNIGTGNCWAPPHTFEQCCSFSNVATMGRVPVMRSETTGAEPRQSFRGCPMASVSFPELKAFSGVKGARIRFEPTAELDAHVFRAGAEDFTRIQQQLSTEIGKKNQHQDDQEDEQGHEDIAEDKQEDHAPLHNCVAMTIPRLYYHLMWLMQSGNLGDDAWRTRTPGEAATLLKGEISGIVDGSDNLQLVEDDVTLWRRVRRRYNRMKRKAAGTCKTTGSSSNSLLSSTTAVSTTSSTPDTTDVQWRTYQDRVLFGSRCSAEAVLAHPSWEKLLFPTGETMASDPDALREDEDQHDKQHLRVFYRITWELLDALALCDLDETELFSMTKLTRAHVYWLLVAFSAELRGILGHEHIEEKRPFFLDLGAAGGIDTGHALSLQTPAIAIEAGRLPMEVLQQRFLRGFFPRMLQTHMWSIVPSKNITYRNLERADEWFSVTDIFQKGDQKMEALPPGVQESEHLKVLRDVFTPELGQNKTRTCREVYVEQLKKRDHTVGALAVKIDLEGLDLKCFRDILGTAPALAVVPANNKGSTPSLASAMTSSTLLPRVISIEVFSAEVAMEAIRTAVRKGYRWIKFVEQSAYFRLICNPRIRGRDGVYGAPRTQRRIFSDNGYRISRIEKGPECYAESGSGPLGDNALDYITGPEWRRLDDDSLTSSPRRDVDVNGDVQGRTAGAAGEALVHPLIARNRITSDHKSAGPSERGARRAAGVGAEKLLDLTTELSLILGPKEEGEGTMVWIARQILRQLDSQTHLPPTSVGQPQTTMSTGAKALAKSPPPPAAPKNSPAKSPPGPAATKPPAKAPPVTAKIPANAPPVAASTTSTTPPVAASTPPVAAKTAPVKAPPVAAAKPAPSPSPPAAATPVKAPPVAAATPAPVKAPPVAAATPAKAPPVAAATPAKAPHVAAAPAPAKAPPAAAAAQQKSSSSMQPPPSPDSPGDDSSSAGGAPRKRKSKLAEHGEAMRLAKTGTSDPTPSSTWTEICVFLLALFVGFYGLSWIVEPYPNDCPRQIQQCLHLGGGKEEVICDVPAARHDDIQRATMCSNGEKDVMFHCMSRRYDLCGRAGELLKWTWDDGVPLPTVPPPAEAGPPKDDAETVVKRAETAVVTQTETGKARETR